MPPLIIVKKHKKVSKDDKKWGQKGVWPIEELAYFAIQYQIQWFKSEPTPTKTGDIL